MFADFVNTLRRRRPFAVADPAVGRQFVANPFDRIEWDAEVHHPPSLAHGELKADQHDHFIGRDNLYQLRIALHPIDFQIQLQYILPGMLHLVEEQAGDPRNQPQFDFRERPSGGWSRGGRAAQETIDDGKQNRRIDIQNQLPFQGRRVDQIEAGWIFQAENEFAVGQLIDTGELHFDNGPQQRGKRRAKIAAESFMHRLQRTHLFLADALGPFEVVGGHLLPRARRTPPRPEPSPVGHVRIVVHGSRDSRLPPGSGCHHS